MLRRQSVLAQVAAITLLFAAEHARAANPSSRIDPAERALVAATRAGAEAQCDCAATSTHRAYLRCVSHAAKTLAAGRLSKGGMHAAMRCAVRSTCGREGMVTCCRTSGTGRTRCAIVPAEKCVAPPGGSACVSAFASWCDAVDQGCTPRQTPHDINCCLPTSAGSFVCEPQKPSECAAKNGIDTGGDGSCAPDPCGNLETTTTSTVPPLCGNGVIDPGEECDPPWSRTCPARGPGHINRECQDNCRCPTTPTNTCPANPAGGPDEIEFVVASQGADLDVGWTGVDHNFPFPVAPNAALKACVRTCGPTGSPPCDLEARTGLGSPNGEAFGPPLPLAAANIPVCIVQRWNGDPTGTIDPLTGDTTLQVNLTSDVHLTTLGKVCPRCTDGQCDSGANAGRGCTVDATMTVAQAIGDKVYNLSSACPPDPAALVAPLDIRLPLTSGTASLAGPKPCGASQDDNCGGSGCGANNCTGDACVSMGTDPSTGDPICIASKGGLSQNCCNSDTAKPCFPTAGGGQIVRMGKPGPPAPPFPDQTYPKTGSAVLAAVFCLPPTGTQSIDATTGPGPGALILPVTHTWLRVPQSGGP